MLIEPRVELSSLSDYVPGKSIEEICERHGLSTAIKLASNENPWGASPKAKEAFSKQANSLHLYPRGDAPSLVKELAKFYKVDSEQIILGNGSDEIIDLIGKAFISKGDICVSVTPTFSVYKFTTLEAGGVFEEYSVNTEKADLSLVAKKAEKAKILFLCNPNNPTGLYYTESEVLKLLELLPKNVLLFLDEAYAEFAVAEDYPHLISRLDEFPNLFINRTFSKIYGLAGLRLGYGISSKDVIKNLWKVKPPFDINIAAQAAGIAALQDREFVEMTKNKNREGMLFLKNAFDSCGFPVLESQGNFLCVHIGEAALDLVSFLESRGMIVRGLSSFSLKEWIRVTVGRPEENEVLAKLLLEWKSKNGK